MLVMLVVLVKQSDLKRSLGAVLMLTGSVLFVLKVGIPQLVLPGDWLHIGMALGLILIAPKTKLAELDEPNSSPAY